MCIRDNEDRIQNKVLQYNICNEICFLGFSPRSYWNWYDLSAIETLMSSGIVISRPTLIILKNDFIIILFYILI